MKMTERKLFLLLLTGILYFTCGFGQNYIPDDKSSSIKFFIKNFGINVSGNFKGLKGTARFLPEDLHSSVFNVSVETATVNTGINARDNHLLKEEYFDVQRFPKISFVSRQIVSGNKAGTYVMTGIFSVKGVNKEISFPFAAVPLHDGMLFTGECKLNRKDFKVGKSSLILADNLTVLLSVFAKKI
jgi:polyisoprenoid-binding protein YceI